MNSKADEGIVDGIEMSDVAADAAAVVAFWSVDATDVLCAAKAANGSFCPSHVL